MRCARSTPSRLVPDRTLLLRIDPETALARSGGRGRWLISSSEPASSPPSPRAYDALAAEAPERFVVLDATLAPERLLSAALEAVELQQ